MRQPDPLAIRIRLFLFKSSFLSETVNSVDKAFFNGGKGFDFNGPRDPLLGPSNPGLTFFEPISDFEFSRDNFSKNAKFWCHRAKLRIQIGQKRNVKNYP